MIGPRPSKHLNAHEYLRIAEIEVKLWKIGGSFPKGFIAEEDTLGEMLSRMIDARILGEKK